MFYKISPNNFIYPFGYTNMPELNSKLLIFNASKIHFLDEIIPEAKYGEILLVPSKIGSFLF